ncbi:hypothetical protein [Salinarimonas sp.]|uniref:hypothetical protein n=1 Tax=Salinarimonas sp. TaxID=2766526 RepID=UPI0032D99CB4
MPTSEIEELNAGMSEIVRSEVAREVAKSANGAAHPNGHEPAPHNGHAAPTMAASREPVRLPRRIAGGFRGLTDDLDRRARDWRAVVRLMEQQRPQLEMAETERERLAEMLARAVSEVQESGKNLKAMLDNTRSGDVSGDLAAQFARQVGALEQLEDVTESLIANFIMLRSTWEQYARSVIQAQGLRDELKPSAT